MDQSLELAMTRKVGWSDTCESIGRGRDIQIPEVQWPASLELPSESHIPVRGSELKHVKQYWEMKPKVNLTHECSPKAHIHTATSTINRDPL